MYLDMILVSTDIEESTNSCIEGLLDLVLSTKVTSRAKKEVQLFMKHSFSVHFLSHRTK